MGAYLPFSSFIFAPPSFWEGMARALDLGGTLSEFNQSLTPEQADYLALASDWRAVGDAMRATIEEYRRRAGIAA